MVIIVRFIASAPLKDCVGKCYLYLHINFVEISLHVHINITYYILHMQSSIARQKGLKNEQQVYIHMYVHTHRYTQLVTQQYICLSTLLYEMCITSHVQTSEQWKEFNATRRPLYTQFMFFPRKQRLLLCSSVHLNNPSWILLDDD